MFGERFAAALRQQAVGVWSPLLVSAYGAHLAFVSEIIPGAVPPLAEVRDAVRRQWDNAQRAEAREQYYASLLRRYRITVDMPPAQADDDRLARSH
jgi:parvulin-like peptidyl-prolyl isomerase